MLLVVAAISFKFYRKFYCTCDQSISDASVPDDELADEMELIVVMIM